MKMWERGIVCICTINLMQMHEFFMKSAHKPQVLVLEVVCVLPDVEAKERDHP